MGFLYFILFVVVLVVIVGWKPSMQSPAHVTAWDKQKIEEMYRWLRNASFFTVPLFLVLAFSFGWLSIHYAVLAAVIPLMFHLGLLKYLSTKNLFIFRHAQQALALVLVRAATAALAASFINGSGTLFFLIINGSIWLFGGNWCFRQLKNNTCWLMEYNSEKIDIADDGSALVQVKQTPAPAAQKPQPGISSQMAQVYLDEGVNLFVKDNNKPAATKKLLLAFQAGTPDIRQRAVEMLDKLGAVEKF